MDRQTAVERSPEIVLPDRFELDREIGRGGMAVVYRAHDRHLGRYVAIKVLSADLSNTLGAERFEREIGLMAKLVNPGIVALFDSGEVGGRLFYVMPLVTGETLRMRLAREQEIGPVASAFGSAVASSLCTIPGLRVVVDDDGNGAGASGDEGSPANGTTTIAGRVRRSGSRLRVSVQVMSTSGALEWAHSADGTVDDPFALEDAIAETVLQHFTERSTGARTTHGTRSGAESSAARGPSGQATPASEVDHLADQGIAAFNKFAPTGGAASVNHLHEAKAYLTRALAIEPGHARGLCALGNWYYVAGVSGIEPREEALARGRALIYSALAADDRVAEVHCSMAKLALYHDDDFYAAARHVRRAVDLDPNEPEALRLQSIVYKILGRPDDAVSAARAATERMPDSAALWNALGDSLLAAGRNAEAVDALKRAISLLPGYGPALERLELARTRLGELDLALELRVSRMQLAGNGKRADLLERDAATLGAADAIRRDARRELDALLKQAETTDPFQDNVRRNAGDRIVSGYAELGLWHEAMDWVQRGYEKRPGRLRRMLTDMPVDFRGLAVDPRYARLLRVAGMEDLI